MGSVPFWAAAPGEGQRHQKTDPAGNASRGAAGKIGLVGANAAASVFPIDCFAQVRQLGAAHCLANFETFELRVIQIQRLVVPCPTMRCAERL
jgi:hypothetical protein